MKNPKKAETKINIEILKPYIKKFSLLIAASFSSMSFFIDSSKYILPDGSKPSSSFFGKIFAHISYAFDNKNIFFVVLLAAFYFLYLKTPKYKGTKGQRGFAAFCSVLIPFMLLLCESYADNGNWDFVFKTAAAVFLSIIKIIGFGFLLYSLFSILSNHDFNVESSYYLQKPLNAKKEILGYTLIFLVFWLPYIILLHPGCFTPDAKDEAAQVIGKYANCWSARAVVLCDDNILLNTHHPVFYTEILNLTIKFGKLIHSYETAFELLCIIQGIALAAVFAYTIFVMKKNGANRRTVALSAAFFALNPLFPCYAMTIVKDTFFCVFITLTIVLTYEILTVERISRARLIAYFAVVFVFILTRNNSIYIMALVLIVILLSRFKTDRKRVVKAGSAILCAIIIFQAGIIGIVNPALKITPGSKRELFSVPFQQTARYINEHEDDISDKERRAIQEVLNGTLEEIGNSYDSTLADPVKRRFNKYATSGEIKTYFKDAWLVGLKKHPSSYIEAYLNLNYRWFSYDTTKNLTYSNISDKHIDKLIKGFDGYMGNEKMRKTVTYFNTMLTEFPLTCVFMKMATYTWVYLILLVYGIKHKRKNALLASSVAYFNYLACFVGPIAYMRYAVPMVCALPFVMFIMFKKDKNKNDV